MSNETVYMASATNRTMKRMVYHTDKDCPRLRDTIIEKPRASVPAHTTLCKYCEGTVAFRAPEEQRESLRHMIESGKVTANE